MVETREKRCANCGGEMEFLKRENVQLGKTGFILGDWPNLLAGALDTEIWCCPGCGKLEFYLPLFREEDTQADDRMAQTTCPVCGVEHDLDDPKCPRCGSKNLKI